MVGKHWWNLLFRRYTSAMEYVALFVFYKLFHKSMINLLKIYFFKIFWKLIFKNTFSYTEKYEFIKLCTAQKMKFSIKDLVTFTEEILNGKWKTSFFCLVMLEKSAVLVALKNIFLKNLWKSHAIANLYCKFRSSHCSIKKGVFLWPVLAGLGWLYVL